MSGKAIRRKSPALTIMKRELGVYFTSPIAYIVTGLFLVITGILFFTAFYLQNRAEMRNMFALMPIILSLFIPALTMRLYAEETKSGSIETLLTLPVTEADVAAGKFLAAFVSSLVMIAPTLLYLLGILPLGSPDMGPIVGGYIGTVFLCAAFCSIGVFASSVTKNQIIAFFTALIICISLTLLSAFLVFLPAPIVGFLQFLSANEHFNSISRGIIDTRDLLYFISITAVFFCITIIGRQEERR